MNPNCVYTFNNAPAVLGRITIGHGARLQYLGPHYLGNSMAELASLVEVARAYRKEVLVVCDFELKPMPVEQD